MERVTEKGDQAKRRCRLGCQSACYLKGWQIARISEKRGQAVVLMAFVAVAVWWLLNTATASEVQALALSSFVATF